MIVRAYRRHTFYCVLLSNLDSEVIAAKQPRSDHALYTTIDVNDTSSLKRIFLDSVSDEDHPASL